MSGQLCDVTEVVSVSRNDFVVQIAMVISH